jgi:DNA-binding GntR family transcriptional regulator
MVDPHYTQTVQGRTTAVNDALGLHIDRRSTSDQAAAVLRSRILRGELRPGTPLEEVRFAGAFGISRNTMREAIRRLVYEGLVQHNLHRGAMVRSLSEEAVSDIYQARMFLEPAAVLASRGRDPDEFAALARIADEMYEASDTLDWVRIADLDMQFHGNVVGFLESRRISGFVRTLFGELRLGLVSLDQEDSEFARAQAREHRRIADLLVEGRQEECADSLKSHLAHAEVKLRSVIAGKRDGAVRPTHDALVP